MADRLKHSNLASILDNTLQGPASFDNTLQSPASQDM